MAQNNLSISNQSGQAPQFSGGGSGEAQLTRVFLNLISSAAGVVGAETVSAAFQDPAQRAVRASALSEAAISAMNSGMTLKDAGIDPKGLEAHTGKDFTSFIVGYQSTEEFKARKKQAEFNRALTESAQFSIANAAFGATGGSNNRRIGQPLGQDQLRPPPQQQFQEQALGQPGATGGEQEVFFGQGANGEMIPLTGPQGITLDQIDAGVLPPGRVQGVEGAMMPTGAGLGQPAAQAGLGQGDAGLENDEFGLRHRIEVMGMEVDPRRLIDVMEQQTAGAVRLATGSGEQAQLQSEDLTRAMQRDLSDEENFRAGIRLGLETNRALGFVGIPPDQIQMIGRALRNGTDIPASILQSMNRAAVQVGNAPLSGKELADYGGGIQKLLKRSQDRIEKGKPFANDGEILAHNTGLISAVFNHQRVYGRAGMSLDRNPSEQQWNDTMKFITQNFTLINAVGETTPWEAVVGGEGLSADQQDQLLNQSRAVFGLPQKTKQELQAFKDLILVPDVLTDPAAEGEAAAAGGEAGAEGNAFTDSTEAELAQVSAIKAKLQQDPDVMNRPAIVTDSVLSDENILAVLRRIDPAAAVARQFQFGNVGVEAAIADIKEQLLAEAGATPTNSPTRTTTLGAASTPTGSPTARRRTRSPTGTPTPSATRTIRASTPTPSRTPSRTPGRPRFGRP